MSGATVKRWFGSHEDAEDPGMIGAMVVAEQKLLRMHVGIWMFFIETVPDFWKQLWNWLLGKLEFLVRVSVRLCRILGLLATWVAIVFGPLWLVPGWSTSGWMILTVSGSIYGLKRARKQRKSASATTLAPTPQVA